MNDVRFDQLNRNALGGVLETIKTLSGHDTVRTEEKFGQIGNIKFYGLMFITSNFSFPIDNNDFSSQYRRIINLHFEKVIGKRNKVLNMMDNQFKPELLNILLLTIILQPQIERILKIADDFDLVTLLHVNKEEQYKLKHSPDPVNLINFILDRMYIVNDNVKLTVESTFVHQAMSLFADYLVNNRSYNVPVYDIYAYRKQFTKALDPKQPFA